MTRPFRPVPSAAENYAEERYLFPRLILVCTSTSNLHTDSGHVFHPVDSSAQFHRRSYGDEQEDEDEVAETTKWERSGTFDSLTVWEHQALPANKEDHWIRGIEEWIAMAGVVWPSSMSPLTLDAWSGV